jgi:hypothetical protein
LEEGYYLMVKYRRRCPSIQDGCDNHQLCQSEGICYYTGTSLDLNENFRQPEKARAVSGLTTDSAARKTVPMATGVIDYFPDALADVARLSQIGNDKHNPGQPLHWSRGKSDDHADCLMRHFAERYKVDSDTVLHATKVAWRALADLQIAIERLRADGVSYP